MPEQEETAQYLIDKGHPDLGAFPQILNRALSLNMTRLAMWLVDSDVSGDMDINAEDSQGTPE